MKPRSKNQIFISYSQKNKAIALDLARYLEAKHYSVWIDNKSIVPGDQVLQSIESGLQTSSDVICLLSNHYLSSPWCNAESSNALYQAITNGDIRVLPILLPGIDEKTIPTFLRSILWIEYDATTPTKSFASLLAGLTARPMIAVETPGSLPRRRHFVGRQEELASVLESLRHPRGWLTSIEGMAGIGKTTLAVEAVHCALQEDIFDAAVWCSAKDFDLSLQDLLVVILESIPHSEATPEGTDYLHQAKHLLSAGRFLLVVDNYESIERDRKEISAFLSNLPAPSKALTTSRRFERLEATHISLGRMLEADALELLRRDWEALYPGRPPRLDLRLIQERTAGNPYFMKMVVRRFKLGSPQERILAFLNEGQGELYSFYSKLWPELSSDARRALLSLSIFAQPAFWDSLCRTSGLSEERLVTAVEELDEMFLLEISDEASEVTRTYQLHSLTRNFAQSILKQDERLKRGLQRSFLSHFLGLTEKHGGRRWDDYASLEREQKNIFSAMELLIELEEWRAVVDIAMRVRHFVIRQDRVSLVPPNRLSEYFAQAKYVCEKGFAAAVKTDSTEDQCRLLLELGNIQIIRGQLEMAQTHLLACVEKCREIRYFKREIMALRRLGHIEARRGDIPAARLLYQQALERAEAVADKIGIGRSQRALGDLAFAEGDFEGAGEFYSQSMQSLDDTTDLVGLPRVARRLGNIYHNRRDFDSALMQFKRVVKLYLGKHDLSGASYALYALGRVQEDRREVEDAILCCLGCLRALSIVHKDLWPSVRAKIEAIPPAGATERPRALHTYVPAVDEIITLCLGSIARGKRRMGSAEFQKLQQEIIDSWRTWTGEWVALIADVEARCMLREGNYPP